MSKYHILCDTDFRNNFDEADSTPTNVNTLTTRTLTHTDKEENRDLLSRINHQSEDDDIIKENNLVHQHQKHNFHTQNHYLHHDVNDHSLKNMDNHVEDLIQYSNNNVIDDVNKNIHNSSNNFATTKKVVKKNVLYFTTSSNDLKAPLDSADTADDYTMDVPLLQQNCDNKDNRRDNHNNKHLYDVESICLCQQKGFSSNLSNNATRIARSKILCLIALCCIFMVIEFIGGYLAGSLAVMADAAHLASDCISFIIGLVAIWLGCKAPDAKLSFGYKRFEVMGAIVSILGIWILTATLVLLAIQHIYSNDYDLNANTMMTISGIGILINIIMIFILHTSALDLPAGSIGSSHGHSHSQNHNCHHGHIHSHTPNSTYRTGSNGNGHLHTVYARSSLLSTGRDVDVGGPADATSIELSSPSMVLNGNLPKHQQDGNYKNINLRAAMIHVIGDLVQSFGVFLAAVLIKIFPKAAFLDPLCTLLFSIIVITTTINLFKESFNLLMDSVPQGLSVHDLETDLLNIEGVKSVHYLNVWNHTSNYSVLMVHLVIDILTDSNTVLKEATHLAESSKYNIKHSTIQIERVNS